MGKNRIYFEYIQIFTISAIFFILILLELFYYVHGDMFEESILEKENIEDIYDKKGEYYNVNYNWITELFEKIEERW